MRGLLGVAVSVSLALWAWPAFGQECVSCWNDSCSDMRAYVPACPKKPKGHAKASKKDEQPKDEGAEQPKPASNCPAGKKASEDTEGHCCWPGQTWGVGAGCVGIPTECPEGMEVKGEACVPAACETGKVRAADGLHCCWKGQAWSRARGECAGIPKACPQGYVVKDESCEEEQKPDFGECPAGQQRPDPMKEPCCFAGQTLDKKDACHGMPTDCPEGTGPDAERQTCADLDVLGMVLSPHRDKPGALPHLVIQYVAKDSPAADVGLLRGDRVLDVEGADVPDLDAYHSALGGHQAGDLVTLHILRKGKTLPAVLRYPDAKKSDPTKSDAKKSDAKK